MGFFTWCLGTHRCSYAPYRGGISLYTGDFYTPLRLYYLVSQPVAEVLAHLHVPVAEVLAHLHVPVAEVLAHLHVQISPISWNVVGSILLVLGKNTDAAIVGYRWTGVEGHPALYCLLVQKSPGCLISYCMATVWAFRISLSVIKFTLKKKKKMNSTLLSDRSPFSLSEGSMFHSVWLYWVWLPLSMAILSMASTQYGYTEYGFHSVWLYWVWLPLSMVWPYWVWLPLSMAILSMASTQYGYRKCRIHERVFSKHLRMGTARMK